MRALITGIAGQTGSYLAELLLSKGYEVAGLVRRSSHQQHPNLAHFQDRLHLLQGDMSDSASLRDAVDVTQPDEIYNLAAMSHVAWSFKTPEHTFDVNTVGYARLLDAVAAKPDISPKIYQAGSSEMFGDVLETPQKETTPFNPRSPYGTSKAAAFYLGKVYREAYGMRIYNGICFNHESPRRGREFLSRKVARGVAEINEGIRDHITLGNLDASRDFGFAGDYADAIWRIVQSPVPDEFVIATGHTYKIRHFVEHAFQSIGIRNWQHYVKFDERFMRPAEVNILKGDASKAKRILGWEPRVSFYGLVEMMVDHEISACRQQASAL